MKAIYKGKLMKLDYYKKKDHFCSVDGEWVAKKNVTVIPTEWTTYALIAIGAYLLGLITTIFF